MITRQGLAFVVLFAVALVSIASTQPGWRKPAAAQTLAMKGSP